MTHSLEDLTHKMVLVNPPQGMVSWVVVIYIYMNLWTMGYSPYQLVRICLCFNLSGAVWFLNEKIRGCTEVLLEWIHDKPRQPGEYRNWGELGYWIGIFFGGYYRHTFSAGWPWNFCPYLGKWSNLTNDLLFLFQKGWFSRDIVKWVGSTTT